MKRGKITISEDGIITLPSNPAEKVWMQDFEIAELFGAMLPTVKSNIRAILKSNVVTEDTTNGATWLVTTFYRIISGWIWLWLLLFG